MGLSYIGKERMEAALDGRKLDRTPVMLMIAGHYAANRHFRQAIRWELQACAKNPLNPRAWYGLLRMANLGLH